MLWTGFKALGGSPVLIAAGLAICAWLLLGRATRMALLWVALFCAGLGIVAATKIAFIGWGMAIDPLDFQGASGHGMRATAVAPVLLHLMLRRAPRRVHACGIVFGMLFGVLMGVAVSVHDTHSVSEAVIGCMVGGAVSLGFIRLSRSLPPPVPDRPLGLIVALGVGVAAFAALHAKSDPTQRWLIRTAAYLSGNDTPFTRQLSPPSDHGPCPRVVSSVRP